MRKETDFPARLEALLDHIGRILPDSGQRRAFRACSLTPLPSALRLNRLVPQSELLRPVLSAQAEPVPWCEDAFAFPGEEQRLGHTLEYALGAFYIQAKATTLAVELLDPRPGERVLDLCAAPGGKATQIAAKMRNRGLLVVNDPSTRRLSSLVGHLERCGVAHAVVTRSPGALMARYFPNYFDRILLDAPCSGDGIVRKDRSMLQYWSVEDARRQAQTQKGLLRAAFHMLRPGGVLVYSTCSLSTEENEEVLLGLMERFPGLVEILPVEGLTAPALPPDLSNSLPEELSRCVRVWPHLHDTEGAFAARIRKKGETEWPVQEEDAHTWRIETRAAPEAIAARRQIEEQWGFEMPIPEGQVLALDRRHLVLRPRESLGIQSGFPFFVRSGMRIGRRHKDHYYLSQQAIVLWGMEMTGPRIELDWEQVRALFSDRALQLPEKAERKGEVLCVFGPWTLCRGIVGPDGRTLEGMLPQTLCRPDLERLV